MIQFFKQHYPFFESFKKAIYVPNIIGVLSFLFVLFFGSVLTYADQKISSIAFIVLFMIYVSQFICRIALPLVFKNIFKYDTWNVGKEIIWLLAELVLAILLGYFLLKVIWQIPSGNRMDKTLQNVIRTVLALQVFIVPLSIFIKKEMVLQKHFAQAKYLNMLLIQYRVGTGKTKIGQKLLFKSNDNQKDLKIEANNLLWIHVTDNYVEVHYLENDSNQKVLLRNTLKTINDVIKDVDYLFQCHRSYIVNLKKVVSINGNSRGYRITIENHDVDIPVSRNKVAEFDKLVSVLMRTDK